MIKKGKYVIEKDIPLPVRGKGYLYEFYKMEIGDSFCVPVSENEYPPNVRTRIAAAAASFKKRYPEYCNWVFCTDITEQGVRIWRDKDKIRKGK